MILLIASWILLWISLTGAGLLLLRAWGKAPQSPEDLFPAFWLGVAASLFVLILWNFAFPVTPWMLLAAAAAGAAGWWRIRKDLGFLRKAVSLRGLILLAVMSTFAVLLAGKATGPIDSGDTGEYHLPIVLWSSAQPVVPGLGNLHPRYAYNQSLFLLDAMLSAGPFAANPQQILNGLLLWSALGQSLLAMARLFSPVGRRAKSNAFLALMLGPLMDQVNQKGFTSLSPDPAIFLIGIVVFALLLQIFADDAPEDGAHAVATAVFLLAAAATIKISFLGYAAAAAILLGGFLIRHARTWPIAGRRAALSAMLAAAAGLIAWTARGYILSGYPAFPSTLGGLGFDFQIPEAAAAAEADWVMLRARNFGVPVEEIVRDSGWFANWYADLPATILKPLELIIATGLAAALAVRRDRLPALRPLALLLIVPLAAIAFWFLLAPAPRFLGSSLWILLALLLFLVLESLPIRDSARQPLPAAAAWLFLAWTLSFVSIPRQLPGSGLILPPDRSIRPATSDRALADGTVIRIPEDDECWSAPQPCTNKFADGLELRTPGNLRDGFRINLDAAAE